MARLRYLATATFFLHAIAVASSLLPSDSKIREKYYRDLFEPYVVATGSWQSWTMFDSAP